MNYKKEIIHVLNNNIINDSKIENLYKQFYIEISDYINYNQELIKTNIIKKYNNQQIYYIQNSKLYISFLEGGEYKFLNDDELIYDISETININVFTTDQKQCIITNIINNIKDDNINDFIPESNTIKNVIDLFQTIVFNNKDYCKYLLIIIGELINKDPTANIFFTNNNLKSIIKDIYDFSYSYFKINSNFIENFKIKFHNHNLNNCYILKCNNYKKIYSNIIKQNIIEIIIVSLYYRKRYTSSNDFLNKHLNSFKIKEEILFLQTNNIESVIKVFKEKYMEDSEVLSITYKDLHYLWKEFCIYQNIPNIVSYNQLLQLFSKEDLNKTSYKLEYISEFIDFWNKNMIEDSDETYFEISEIQQLFKHKYNTVISETKIINIITHFFNNIEIDNDKYIHNIKCNLFDKKTRITQFKYDSEYEESNPNKLYKLYLAWETTHINISKTYFLKYI